MLVGSNNVNPDHPCLLTVEITVISAEGLKNPSSSLFCAIFSNRLKTFVTLAPTTTTLSSPWDPPPDDTKLQSSVHRTKTDSRGGKNPAWGETFQISANTGSNLISGFASSAVLLRVYMEGNLISGTTLLGWCHIPIADVRWPPTGSVRFLSYRLRARDGTRSEGVVNLAVRLQGSFTLAPKGHYPSITSQACPAIGIPVSMVRAPATMNYNK